MFVVPSTLQVALAVVLVLLGVCGNLVILFVCYRTTLRCPHITVLAALDLTATLLGPGVILLTIVIGPTWLEHDRTLCHSLSFVSCWMLFACFLVVFSLAVFCQKVKRDDTRLGRERYVRRREFVYLALCLLTGLMLSIPPLAGWSSYNGLSFLHPCSLTNKSQSISNYSLVYLLTSFVVLSVTIVLVFRARKHRQSYPVQILWERHELETKINDPELTTTASSNTSSYNSRSRTKSIHSRIQSRIQSRNQSRIHSRNQSRRSSVRSRSGTILSFDSPMMSRKNSQMARALENSLLEIIFRNARGENDAGEIMSEAFSERSPSPVNSERKDSQSSSPSIQLSIAASQASFPRAPFVISPKIPCNVHALLYIRRVFQNPRFLPQFTALQQQRSLLRLLSLRCCVTLLCWLPLYATVVLQLSSVHYPHELLVFIQWLIFTRSSISSLLPLCDASYRRALKRAANSVFKACARRNETRADLSKSHDVELKIEGTEQVQLRNVISNKL